MAENFWIFELWLTGDDLIISLFWDRRREGVIFYLLEAELDTILGYEKHDDENKDTENQRNGHSQNGSQWIRRCHLTNIPRL